MSTDSESNPQDPKSGTDAFRRRKLSRLIAGGAIVCLLIGAVVYSLTGSSPPAAPLAEPIEGASPAAREPTVVASQRPARVRSTEFVGSQACADCHAEIADLYAKHPMAQTLAAVADATPIESLQGDAAEFEAQGCRYRVERRGGRVIHTEFMTNDDELVYEQSVDVHYAVGSGRTARSYLIDRGGILFESPVTWYVDGQRWDLSPGYKDNPRQRFNRRVIDGCVQCHSGRAAPTGDWNSSHFEEPPFLELGIGCEQCHGPGQKHVELMSSTDADSGGDLLIVNPSHLDQLRAEAICYQCHRDGKRRILRKGKSFYDFQPGMATEDVWTVFASPAPFATDGAAPFTSHVEQMHASACFQGSDGRMSCTTCHDPHRAPAADERAAFYRERCNSCHDSHGCSLPLAEREAPPALDSCIHCHMPTAGSSDIPHATQSDHRVLRDPENPPAAASASGNSTIWAIFDDSIACLPESEIDRARAIALSDQAVEKVDPSLMQQAIAALEKTLSRDSDDSEAWRSLAFLYAIRRDPVKAKLAFEAALQADPGDELSMKNLGLLAYRTRSLDTARRSYDAYMALNPWDPTMFGPYSAILATAGDLQGAIAAAERGLELDPTLRELRSMTAKLYERLGDLAKSEEHVKKLRIISERLDPWDQQRRERLQREAEAVRQANP